MTTNALAERLGVTAASRVGHGQEARRRSASSRHEPYRGVELTRDGERVALEVLRHHRLLELYLAERLGMPWDRVHDEAEVLEHVISEELEELIAAKLGHPTHDPHGDPIPTADLAIEERPTRALQSLTAGDRGVFVRVSDSDPEMLRYLGDRGIAPGDHFEVVDKQPFDGPAVRALRRRDARARRRACRGDAGGSRAVNPPPPATMSATPPPEVVPAPPAVAERAAADPLARAPARARWRCSARPSSPASPTSTRATSRRTSPAAPSTATCCCGSCSPPT